jgi:NAD(P)-dependent dehydrogenase (short-subunit alcohol dehydrogenase family)
MTLLDTPTSHHLRHILVVGAGSGLSASVARRFAAEGLAVSLAARDTDKLSGLASEVSAEVYPCDASQSDQVDTLFANLDKAATGAPDVVIYNPSARVRGSITELNPDDVHHALMVTAFGGFLVARAAARRMEAAGRGVIIFTGASASVKGYALSAPFAMGKFALRGLAQSLAREMQPKGVHVAHGNIDGGIENPAREGRVSPPDKPDSMLSPDAIADHYWHLATQHRSAWTFESELRPWLERF